MTVDAFFELDVFGTPQARKREMMARELERLTLHHRAACPSYDTILAAYPDDRLPGGPEAPFIPVSLFKTHDLASIPKDRVFKTMTSSGTTGQMPSRIVLDADTAQRQTRTLVKIMTSIIGPKRLPLLIVDHPSVVRDRKSFSARGAGILGMMTFGRDTTFALEDEGMEIDFGAIDDFTRRHAGRKVLVFGFTFMVWKHFVERLSKSGRSIDLNDAILVHSGGWKKLEDEKVSDQKFKDECRRVAGISSVHNFYGMVEQTGSVYVECEAGRLHASIFSDVIIRDPVDWTECGIGVTGLIQVVSVLPHSYPGHSLLTEDLGVLTGEDDCPCGRLGRTFKVLGRLPKAEVRGCSDTFASPSPAAANG